MSTNLLNIFSKDTGATATEQGYHYQKLKTLKTWLENRIAGKDELIYCDTEEDIVQRDIAAGTIRFRQVKLYSTNFSFSTEEVTKSLTNFFMLYAKGDYLFEEAVFVFETNANIAKETRGNDADMLRDWAKDQGNLTGKTLSKCIARVQEILDPYIKAGYDKEKAKDYEGAFLKAKSFYEQLPEEFWTTFVQAVRWDFDVIPQEEAIRQLTAEIEELLRQLPLPIDVQKASGYIAALHWEIVQRTIDSSPERRVLSNGLIDYLVLHHGNKKSQWYAAVYEQWSAQQQVKTLHTGQFLEAVAAIRHCRWYLAGTGHEALWLDIIRQYIQWRDISTPFKRKAIYEYFFLKVHTAFLKGEPDFTVANDAELVADYFAQLEERYELRDIEEDISMVQVATTAAKWTEGFAAEALIKHWTEQVSASIEAHLTVPRDVNEYCMLLEMKGTALISFDQGMRDIERVRASMDIFRRIAEVLPAAHTYTISRLSDFLKEIANVYRAFSEKFEDMVDEIETFRREIAAQAPETDRRHKAALDFVTSGSVELEAGAPRNFLRALNIFHQAVQNWRMEDTMDAYVLGLIGMSKVYLALGANYASKYYALCALWATRNTGDERCFAKQGLCYEAAYRADLLQGAWLSAMAVYLPYMNYRNEFDTSDPAADDNVIKNFIDLLRILEGAEHLHPDLVHLIAFYKTQLREFYSEEMNSVVDQMKKHIAESDHPAVFVTGQIIDTPFNDAGAERVIRFKMLNVTWQIYFDNTFITTGIAEEFAAVLQITLCEIGLYGRDIQLPRQVVRINIQQGDEALNQIKQEQNIWQLVVPYRDKHEPESARLHYSFLGMNVQTLLATLSPLGPEAMKELYMLLLKKRELGNKALSATTYQRAYFCAFDQEGYDRLAGRHFAQVPGRFDHPSADTLANTIRQ